LVILMHRERQDKSVHIIFGRREIERSLMQFRQRTRQRQPYARTGLILVCFQPIKRLKYLLPVVVRYYVAVTPDFYGELSLLKSTGQHADAHLALRILDRVIEQIA